MDINAAVGGQAGVSREKIEAALGVRDGTELSERERLALEYADRVSATPVDVPDEFFARLRSLFSEREIVELTGHLAHENYHARSARPLRVEPTTCARYPLHGQRVETIRLSPMRCSRRVYGRNGEHRRATKRAIGRTKLDLERWEKGTSSTVLA